LKNKTKNVHPQTRTLFCYLKILFFFCGICFFIHTFFCWHLFFFSFTEKTNLFFLKKNWKKSFSKKKSFHPKKFEKNGKSIFSKNTKSFRLRLKCFFVFSRKKHFFKKKGPLQFPFLKTKMFGFTNKQVLICGIPSSVYLIFFFFKNTYDDQIL
jgi:hypothetical protein